MSRGRCSAVLRGSESSQCAFPTRLRAAHTHKLPPALLRVSVDGEARVVQRSHALQCRHRHHQQQKQKQEKLRHAAPEHKNSKPQRCFFPLTTNTHISCLSTQIAEIHKDRDPFMCLVNMAMQLTRVDAFEKEVEAVDPSAARCVRSLKPILMSSQKADAESSKDK
eukprot:3360754-Rhodomonas_salina.1